MSTIAIEYSLCTGQFLLPPGTQRAEVILDSNDSTQLRERSWSISQTLRMGHPLISKQLWYWERSILLPKNPSLAKKLIAKQLWDKLICSICGIGIMWLITGLSLKNPKLLANTVAAYPAP